MRFVHHLTNLEIKQRINFYLYGLAHTTKEQMILYITSLSDAANITTNSIVFVWINIGAAFMYNETQWS